jgi:bifunctional non-homologous end joining protein LigD
VHVENRDGLIGLVQSGTLEIHPWGSRIGDIERPDRIIIDLDPGPGVTWEDICTAAEDVRARLKAKGLTSFVKTTGGKGLHVVAPLVPKGDWAVVKDFTHQIASDMAKDEPEKFVATMTKVKRKGRIFVDYLRNGRGSTAVSAFSTRSRDGAPVATPVAWNELGPGLSPNRVTVETLGARLAHLKRDPWAGFFSVKQSILAKGSTGRRRGR